MRCEYIVNAYSRPISLIAALKLHPARAETKRDEQNVFYSVSRMAPAIAAFVLWVLTRDGRNIADPAHLFLVVGFLLGALGLSSVRRYWHIRATSRSRRDSTLFL